MMWTHCMTAAWRRVPRSPRWRFRRRTIAASRPKIRKVRSGSLHSAWDDQRSARDKTFRSPIRADASVAQGGPFEHDGVGMARLWMVRVRTGVPRQPYGGRVSAMAGQWSTLQPWRWWKKLVVVGVVVALWFAFMWWTQAGGSAS